ncbi:hypothetical protein [Poseidonocella pacifica]|nr:hypothetical protein [Poseidonocella pacifica]
MMKRIFILFFLLSSCMASDETGYEIAFAETSIEVVQKICGVPETLNIYPFTPEVRGEIDKRYTFFFGKSVEGRTLIFIGGFEDGCLRYVLSESLVVYSVYGLTSLLVDIPVFYGFPPLQSWLSRKREAGGNLDEYLILSSRIFNYEPPVRRELIFGPKGLEVGAARLGQQRSIVISER